MFGAISAITSAIGTVLNFIVSTITYHDFWLGLSVLRLF